MKRKENAASLLLSPYVLRTSDNFETMSNNRIKNRLFFYPIQSPESGSRTNKKDITISNYNDINVDKIRYQKVDLNSGISKNRLSSTISNFSQDLLLSPTNKIYNKAAIINDGNSTKVVANEKSSIMALSKSRLSVLEMTTAPQERREAENKLVMKEINSYNRDHNIRVSEITKNKLNTIYQLAGQELG